MEGLNDINSNFVYHKNEILPGRYEITGSCGNVLKKAGVRYPFPVSEEVADILINDLIDILAIKYGLDVFNPEDWATIQEVHKMTESECIAIKVLAGIMRLKNGVEENSTGGIEKMVRSDRFLFMDMQDGRAVLSKYTYEAEKYFRKYGMHLPLSNYNEETTAIVEKTNIFIEMFIEEVKKLSGIEKVTLFQLHKYLQEYSIVMPYLWIKNIIHFGDMMESFRHIFYGPIDYDKPNSKNNFCIKESDINKAVVYYRSRVRSLDKLLKQYVSDEVEMSVN